MKRFIILMVLLGMVGGVSATELRFTDIFSECTPEMGYVECSSRFFVPNLHLNAAKVLLWDSVTRVFTGVIDWFDGVVAVLFEPEFSFSWLLALLGAVVIGFLSFVLDYIVGVISGVLVFIVILAFEFIKNYLLISTAWLCLSRALSVDAELFSLDRAFLVGALMVVGSIFLLTLDWGNAVSGVIG